MGDMTPDKDMNFNIQGGEQVNMRDLYDLVGTGRLSELAIETAYGTYDPTQRGGVRNEYIELNGAGFGSSGADITGYQRNSQTAGDFTAMGGPSPGQVFAGNDFNILANTTGISTFYGNLSEVAITATTTSGVAYVFGFCAEVSHFGLGADSHVGNMTSLRVLSPKRKEGALGTADSLYSLYIEGVEAGDVGSTDALSLYVDSGISRFNGRVDVQATIMGVGAGDQALSLQGGSAADSASIAIYNGTTAQDITATLGGDAGTDRFYISNKSGAAQFFMTAGGRLGLPNTLTREAQVQVGGAASPLPALPVGYMAIELNGATVTIPYYGFA